MSVDQVATVALVGAPNSGKTTLFNWLTGSKFRTVNFAGSTVDCFRGQTLNVYGPSLSVFDTPGVYSLQPHGRDEEITQGLLLNSDTKAVVVVIDGTQLNRQLYLVRQIQELGLPLVVAVTMMDMVIRSGRRLNLDRLSSLIGAPVVAVDGRLGSGVKEVVSAARDLQAKNHNQSASLNWDPSRIEQEIAQAEDWTRQVVTPGSSTSSMEAWRKWDRILMHPFFGVIAFLVIMTALFSSIFWLAAPLMDIVDGFFGWLALHTQNLLGEGPLGDFVANGVIGGVGAVMVFVPQIFILFVGLNLLEDSGYLARAATIVDRPLQKIGLSGRAFVPLLSGFACAVPAILATRNIRSERERWITAFIIPLMTCSARLPVYALLLTFLLTEVSALWAGAAMTALYLGGVISGAVAAAVLNKIVKISGPSYFLMELPFYRWPGMKIAVKSAARRTFSYVQKAGPTIFVFVLLLWTGSHFPYQSGATPTQQLEQSVVGQVGKVMEPVFEPMGLDWRAGLGIVSAFVAREVFVSAMAVIFSIADEDEASLQNGLLNQMRTATRADGSPLFTVGSVVGLLVFFMIALQCLSTTGVSWREMGSWKFAVVQLVVFNAVAYVLAVAVYQLMG